MRILSIVLVLILGSFDSYAQLSDECKLKIGTNFSGLADWGTELPFVDLMHNARTWYTKSDGDPNDPFDSGYTALLEYREDGYPTHIPQQIPESDYPQEVATIWAITDGWPAGKYTILWEGSGEFLLWGSYENLQQTDSHRMTFDFPNPIGGILELRIIKSELSDPIHNIRVLMPGTEDTYEDQPFYSLWLEKISPFKSARFMDWGQTNNWGQHTWEWDDPALFNWDDRARMDYYTWATGKGIPYEMMIKLMNDYDLDGWVCVPHRASDEYIEKMATLFRDNLNPERLLTVEYSNELWNWIFGQAQWLNKYGCINQNKIWPEGIVPYIQNCLDIWSQVYEGQLDRIVRVAGVQTGYQDVSNRIVRNLSPGSFDAIAPTFYFGLSDEGDTALDALGSNATAQDVAYYARKGMQETKDNILRQKNELANPLGVPMRFYEGGQHLTPHPFGEDPSYAQALLDIQRDTAMYNLYREWFGFLRTLQEGDKPLELMNFAFVKQRSAKYGSWGILETMNQDTSLIPAPKYAAIIEEINGCNPSYTKETDASTTYHWKISPNPANDILTISGNLLDVGIEIFDCQGNKMISKKVNAHASIFSVNDFPKGLYFVKITDFKNGFTATQKIVIQ